MQRRPHPVIVAWGAAALVGLVACPEVLPPPGDAGPIGDDAGASDAGALVDGGRSPMEAGPVGDDAGPLEGDGGTLPADAGAPADAGIAGTDAGAADGGALVDGGGGIVPGSLAVGWIHGADDCGSSADPALQVHAYNDDTWILRQSKCVNFEAPFLYLIVGQERALLLDTGATSQAAQFPVRDTVEQLLTTYLGGAARSSLELVVAHTHGHGDHRAGDGQFQGQPDTTLVGTSQGEVAAYFGFTTWPEDAVTFDLGGRVLDVLPIPGHEQSHVAFYDRDTALLLTGDTLYPGFLFVSQWQTYRASIARLAAFAQQVPITWVLGTHVEMTDTPGQAYPYGTTWQPAEHVLQLELSDLLELDAALEALGDSPATSVHDDFIISP